MEAYSATSSLEHGDQGEVWDSTGYVTPFYETGLVLYLAEGVSCSDAWASIE